MKHIDQYEELYRAYIGEKNQDQYYERLHKGGFNWAAFLISDLLLLVRKMFGETMLIIFIRCLKNTVLDILDAPKAVINMTNILISLVLGFTYYYLYRWHIERQIKKYQKKGLSYEEQLKMAKECGGDTITIGVVGMFIVEFLFILLCAVMEFAVLTFMGKEI